MKSAILPMLLLIGSMVNSTQQSAQPGLKKGIAPRAMCDAAAPKLRESGSHEVVLTMVVDTRGKVQSFKTESPKGLRLEKMKEPAAVIKALHFQPATKDGQPVMVMIRVEFDCSEPAADGLQKQ